jgi:hypothetical protein
MPYLIPPITPNISSLNLPDIYDEAELVQKLFKKELDAWKERKINLLILGEAPLSAKKYFYGHTPGGYLSGLRAHLKVEQTELLSKLRECGIFNLDLYPNPLATKHYDDDHKNSLFSHAYLEDRLTQMTKAGILDIGTPVNTVYRYKKLIARKLPLKSFGFKFINDNKNSPISLFSQERPNQIISPQILPYICP